MRKSEESFLIPFNHTSTTVNAVSTESIPDVDYRTDIQDLKTSLAYIISLIGTIAGKDTSNTITNQADITQNFYAPTVDAYTVKNAASLAVSAAQAKACRM